MIEPSEIAGAFWRYRWRVAIFVVLVSMATLAAVVFMPREFASESKLFVRVGRESVGLDPTATTGQTMPIQSNREVEVQSVLQLLQSQGLLEEVIDQIGAQELLVDPDPNWMSALGSNLSRLKGQLKTALLGEGDLSPEQIQREEALELLKDKVGMSVAEDSTVITVSARARSPELAQQITSTLVDAYLQEHARIHRTAGSEAFFVEQTERIGAELDETLAELRDLKNEHALVSIEGQLELIETQQADIEQEQLRTARMLAESQSTYEALSDALGDHEALVLAEQEQRPSEASDTMRHKLFDLEMKEQEFQSKYTKDHPLMQALSLQVNEARRIHEGVEEFREEPTYAINPTRQKLELDLVASKSRLVSLKAVDESLDLQEKELLAKLHAVNEHSLRIARLEREAQRLNESYDAYAVNLEQARIDGALQRQHITNVNIAQTATLSHRPASPHGIILLALGAVVAVGGSFGLVFGSERVNRRLRSAEEIEADLSIPVLMTLPRFVNRGSLATALSDEK